ncbi:MAG TPA: alpha-amylase/4-alpha-glucanotransferase domain-containing protein [Candidatus Acidoferrales bacterium]|nr:alpha-amylase/4-alpha-glucanotransferase domain-containing protein [Candidatus Acidoferrales bacterium]
MPKIHLILVIHAHQPVGNFDSVIENVYQQSYLPFLEHLSRHPSVRIGLHYSGSLLDWLEEHHPEFLDKLGSMSERGQIEILGGGFYEPILISIPAADQQEQIRRMSEYIRKQFSRAPAGAWLAERVWEPDLPAVLEAANVEYTLLDDVHFTSAGIEAEDLFGYYIAEDRGSKVKVIPGLKSLRYLVPFRDVEETIGFLRSAAERHHGGMAAMGDDCEKFGAWPGTYDHCYRDGWVERFLTALERNQDWLGITPPGEYLREHAPLGRADMPAASYTELMEWVLPTRAREQLHAVQEEFSARPDVLRFLRGGIWRGFLSKYPEVNLLHKKMLDVSRKVAAAGQAKLSPATRLNVDEARSHLLRAQCNDAYWHGVFGGLYSPHLRTELWRDLIRAEGILDATGNARAQNISFETKDFDADGVDEICVKGRTFAAIVKPSDGGTVPMLDFRPSAVALVNSLQRRPEAYHARLALAAQAPAGGVVSIHDIVRVKEPGLEQRLRYDRWPRNSFRLLLFPQGKTWADYEALKLEEGSAFAAGKYSAADSAKGHITLKLEAPLEWNGSASSSTRIAATRVIHFDESGDEFSVDCSVSFRGAANSTGGAVQMMAGVEIILNFLAPSEADRYFEYKRDGQAERQRLGWGGEISDNTLRVVDDWQNVAAVLESPLDGKSGGKFWVAPIETVSESEDGFERVYQGSQILGVCPVKLEPGGEWTGRWTLRVSKSHS